MTQVYILYRELSDQYGKDEIVGAYSTEELALKAMEEIKNHRAWIKPVDLDPVPPTVPYHVAFLLRRMGL